MSHNNAGEVNVECEKTMTSLLDLNDFALLHVFSYLNLRDSINFAVTSKRLQNVGGLHFTKYKRFDLLKYEWSDQPKRLPAETVLFYIGQHITTLSINSMRSTVAQAVMDNCVNVTTLKIYDCADTSELKKWMQQLKLDSLTIESVSNFNKISVRLEALKELHFTNGNDGLRYTQLTNILEKTTELETLKVDLLSYPNFNYDIFTRLPKLQCLDLHINSGDLVNLTGFLKLDVLTKFKIFLPMMNSGVSDAKTLQRLNWFLEILAESSKLDELQLWTSSVDHNTFHILKSFHVTSLRLFTVFYRDQCQDHCICMFHQLVNAQPNLKHLDFCNTCLPIEHVDFMIKNLVKLETLTFDMQKEDLDQLDVFRINEMLNTSTTRPMLTLYINSGYGGGVKIELRFEQRRHRIVELGLNDLYFLTDHFTG